MPPEPRHIREIADFTRATLKTNLEAGQNAIESDGNKVVAWKDDGGLYHVGAEQKLEGRVGVNVFGDTAIDGGDLVIVGGDVIFIGGDQSVGNGPAASRIFFAAPGTDQMDFYVLNVLQLQIDIPAGSIDIPNLNLTLADGNVILANGRYVGMELTVNDSQMEFSTTKVQISPAAGGTSVVDLILPNDLIFFQGDDHIIGIELVSSGNGHNLTVAAGETTADTGSATGGTLDLVGGQADDIGGVVNVTGGAATDIGDGVGGPVNIDGGAGDAVDGPINIGTSNSGIVSIESKIGNVNITAAVDIDLIPAASGSVNITQDGVELTFGIDQDFSIQWGGSNVNFLMNTGSGTFLFDSDTNVTQDCKLQLNAGQAKDAIIILVNDSNDDNGDQWRIKNTAATNKLTFENNATGSFVSVLTLGSDQVGIDGAMSLTNIVRDSTAGPATIDAGLEICWAGFLGSDDITYKLPAAPATGELRMIKHNGGGNNLTVDGNGKNIDLAATKLLTAGLGIIIAYNGTEWNIFANI